MRTLLFISLLFLSSCGFHLRGQENLPFDRLQISPENSSMANALKQAIEAGTGTKVVEAGAAYRLEILDESRDRVILALDSAGQVREYQLRYRVAYRLLGPGEKAVIPRSVLEMSRIMSYDNTQILAKAGEASLLYGNMQQDAVGQILVRMSAIHPDEN